MRLQLTDSGESGVTVESGCDSIGLILNVGWVDDPLGVWLTADEAAALGAALTMHAQQLASRTNE
jgi:hypothetical protein